MRRCHEHYEAKDTVKAADGANTTTRLDGQIRRMQRLERIQWMKGQTTVFQKSGEMTTAVKADKHHDTLSNEPILFLVEIEP
jgi:hypothetical protein